MLKLILIFCLENGTGIRFGLEDGFVMRRGFRILEFDLDIDDLSLVTISEIRFRRG